MGLTLAAASTVAMKQASYERVLLVRALLKRGVFRAT
jgi:hypothetical protein